MSSNDLWYFDKERKMIIYKNLPRKWIFNEEIRKRYCFKNPPFSDAIKNEQSKAQSK